MGANAPVLAGVRAETPGEDLVQDESLNLATDMQAALDVAFLISKRGARDEYLDFAESVRVQTGGENAFDFIRHACEGTGGFQTAQYLDPHTREVGVIQSATPGGIVVSTTGSRGSEKYQTRKKMSDYDNFPRTIRDTHWGYIKKHKDMIKRDSPYPEVQQFWRNADGKGTDVVDSLAPSFRESRMFSFNLIMVDRPQLPPNPTAAETDDPKNAAYMFSVPSKNVVWWEFNDTTKEIELIAYLDPQDDDDLEAVNDTVKKTYEVPPAPLKVWTPLLWVRFIAVRNTDGSDTKWRYELDSWKPHPCGEVPCVIFHDDEPVPGKMFGSTEMREIALIAKTVYNLDSERREILRNCSFPQLFIPTSDPNAIGTLVMSTEGAVGFDGPGVPLYLTPDLAGVAALKAERQEKKQQAYEMAHLKALMGNVETTSGFHSTVEFEKTNQRIGRSATQWEDVEMKLAWLVCKWHGHTEQELDEAFARADADNKAPFSVSYPKDFGLRDYDVLIKRADDIIEMNLGDEVNQAALADLLSSLFPRFPKSKIDDMVVSALASINAEKEATRLAADPGATAATLASARMRRVLQESGIAGVPISKPAAATAPPQKA